MIVGPHKGIFFVATALMCSASLYGAELSVPEQQSVDEGIRRRTQPTDVAAWLSGRCAGEP